MHIAPEHVQTLMNDIFWSKEWVQLDLGILTEKEAIELWVKRSECPEAILRDVVDHWMEMLTPIDGTVEILMELRKMGYATYFLSNFHAAAFDEVCVRFEFMGLFVGGIVSFKVKLIKPDAAIFQRLAESCGILPEESVFIDDMEANVEGGARCGFEGILYTSPEDLRKSLSRRGIDI
jgi:putative hydrolase of the HAD superfamily